MSYFLVPEDWVVFPHPSLVDDSDGLLAFGGELTTDRLLLAYHFGIFPWFNPGEQVMWFFPDPRSVIFPENLKVAKSMRTYFNNDTYRWTLNKDFDAVIRHCQTASNRAIEGTWIGDEIISAYTALHRQGIAHSVEVWDGEELVGGLYGIWLNRVFFGESMFSLKKNASKFGFISFVKHFADQGKIKLVDCQIENSHLNSLGATNIPGEVFMEYIRRWAWRR